MGKNVLTFCNTEIEKNKFFHHKTPFFFFFGDADIEKALVSNKISFAEKNYMYFIGYWYNGNKVKPLSIIVNPMLILIIHWINQVSIDINIGYIINLYQDWLLLIILVSILAIVIFYHPVQALVQIYIIADITGCKKNTKTVSYLLYYLFPIYQW